MTKKKPQSIDEYLMDLFIDILVQVLTMPDEMIDLLVQAANDEENRREDIKRIIEKRTAKKMGED